MLIYIYNTFFAIMNPWKVFILWLEYRQIENARAEFTKNELKARAEFIQNEVFDATYGSFQVVDMIKFTSGNIKPRITRSERISNDS